MIVAYFINFDKPMRIKCKNLGLGTILGMLIIYLILTTIFHPLQQDEGVFLTIGQNLVKGYLPYRDFFDHKPPGIYWLLAGLNLIFDNRIVWYKITLIATNLASAWLVFKIAHILTQKNTLKGDLKKVGDQASAWKQQTKVCSTTHGYIRKTLQAKKLTPNACLLWAPIFFLWLTLVFEGQYLIAEPFVAFFLLLGLYLYLLALLFRETEQTYLPTGRGIPFLILFSGLAFGFAILFKQTAILSALAFLIVLTWQRQWKQLAYFCFGIFIPILLTVLYLWRCNILVDAYRQIILYNFQNYPSENIFKVLDLLSATFLYTLPVWILFIYGVIKFSVIARRLSLFRPTKQSGNSSLVHLDNLSSTCAIALLAILPMFAYFGRHYPHYWLQSAPFVAILAAITLHPSLKLRTTGKGGLEVPGSQASACKKQTKVCSQERGAQALACFFILSVSLFTYNFLHLNYPKYLGERQLTQFLHQQNQPIYAENQFIGLYFLTRKTPPIRYLYITEVDDWSEQAEQKTIELLKNNDGLIIWPEDCNYAYAKDLQAYIFNNYKPIYHQDELGVVVYKPQMNDESTK